MAGFITLKCPSCGAKLNFEKTAGLFSCDHCGNVHMLDTRGHVVATRYDLATQDWLRVGDYDIFIHEMAEDCSDGQRIVYLNVEYRNERFNGMLSCRANQWLLYDSDNYSYEYLTSSKPVYETRNRPYFGGERFLNPNMHARGWLGFKVPPGATITRLQFFTSFLSTKTVDILLKG